MVHTSKVSHDSSANVFIVEGTIDHPGAGELFPAGWTARLVGVEIKPSPGAGIRYAFGIGLAPSARSRIVNAKKVKK